MLCEPGCGLFADAVPVAYAHDVYFLRLSCVFPTSFLRLSCVLHAVNRSVNRPVNIPVNRPVALICVTKSTGNPSFALLRCAYFYGLSPDF